MSKECYAQQKVPMTACKVFFAKYYDDLKQIISECKEVQDVLISFDRAIVNMDLEFLEFVNDDARNNSWKIVFELQRKVLQLTNREKIVNSINCSTAAKFRKNPVSFKDLALLKFAEDGKLSLFKQVVCDGANYNCVYHEWGRYSNITPLFLAAYNDHVNIVMHIVEIAEQKQEVKQVLNFKNVQGFSAFSIAYYMRSLSVLSFLLEHDKDILEDLETYKDLCTKYPLRSLNNEKILQNRLEFDNKMLNLPNFK